MGKWEDWLMVFDRILDSVPEDVRRSSYQLSSYSTHREILALLRNNEQKVNSACCEFLKTGMWPSLTEDELVALTRRIDCIRYFLHAMAFSQMEYEENIIPAPGDSEAHKSTVIRYFLLDFWLFFRPDWEHVSPDLGNWLSNNETSSLEDMVQSRIQALSRPIAKEVASQLGKRIHPFSKILDSMKSDGKRKNATLRRDSWAAKLTRQQQAEIIDFFDKNGFPKTVTYCKDHYGIDLKRTSFYRFRSRYVHGAR